MSFLNGKDLSLNRTAMASPSEKFSSRLKKAKAKFQAMIRTRGPRKAGLVKNSLKLANATASLKPGALDTPFGEGNVPRRFRYTTPVSWLTIASRSGAET